MDQANHLETERIRVLDALKKELEVFKAELDVNSPTYKPALHFAQSDYNNAIFWINEIAKQGVDIVTMSSSFSFDSRLRVTRLYVQDAFPMLSEVTDDELLAHEEQFIKDSITTDESIHSLANGIHQEIISIIEQAPDNPNGFNFLIRDFDEVTPDNEELIMHILCLNHLVMEGPSDPNNAFDGYQGCFVTYPSQPVLSSPLN